MIVCLQALVKAPPFRNQYGDTIVASELSPQPHKVLVVASALTIFIAFASVSPAWAWGRLGHRVISRIAENKLTSRARAAVAEFLEPGDSLADVSTWADEVRNQI